MVDIFSAMHAVRARAEAVTLHALLGLPRPVLRRLVGRPVRLDGQTLDVEMQAILRLREVAGVPLVENLPLPAGRAQLREESIVAGGRQPVGECRALRVPGPAGADLPARLYAPRGVTGPTPLLFFVHGGGWVYGDLDSHEGLCRYLAERAGVRVLAVDYRKAPEHRYPAALDDCFAAYSWVHAHADDLGADPTRLVVGGDDAGANLSAAVCLRAREEAGAQPVAQLLLYPATDFSQRLPSRAMFHEGFYLSKGFMDRCEAAYIAPGIDTTDPFLSPLQAKDLSGLAPAYIATAGFDPLRDEGEAYARRIADDGGTVELKRHPGLLHGYGNMIGVSRSARGAVNEVVQRLRAL